MDTQCFLNTFQNHCYSFGLPRTVYADAGSNFAAGFSLLWEVFNSVEVKEYFDQYNINIPCFDQYPRGSLTKGIPGFIESGVKLVKTNSGSNQKFHFKFRVIYKYYQPSHLFSKQKDL